MTTDLGKIVLTARGEYDAETEYETLDTVTYQGSMYIAKQNTQGNPPTSTVYWMLGANGNDYLANQLLDAQPTATATGETINVNDSANLPLKNFELQGNATQADTPTPATPQAIHVVTGDNTVKVTGKNLLSPDEFGQFVVDTPYSSSNISTYDSETGILNVKMGDGTKFNLEFKENTTYTFIFKLNTSINTTNLRIRYTDDTTTNIYNGTLDTITTLLFTSASNKTIKGIEHYAGNSTGTRTIYLFESGIFEGAITAEQFEKYIGQSVTLPLGDIELAKIGDYADRIYKDNGKWYVEKNIGTKVLNGSESWTSGSTACWTTIFTSTALAIPASFGNAGFANNFPIVSYNFGSQNNMYFHTNMNLMKSYDETFATRDVFKTWLTSNSQTVYYILATPTTTEITDQALLTALEQALAMTTYKTTTNGFTLTVSDNATPTLQIEYRQDIGTYIHRLETLEARVELLES